MHLDNHPPTNDLPMSFSDFFFPFFSVVTFSDLERQLAHQRSKLHPFRKGNMSSSCKQLQECETVTDSASKAKTFAFRAVNVFE